MHARFRLGTQPPANGRPPSRFQRIAITFSSCKTSNFSSSYSLLADLPTVFSGYRRNNSSAIPCSMHLMWIAVIPRPLLHHRRPLRSLLPRGAPSATNSPLVVTLRLWTRSPVTRRCRFGGFYRYRRSCSSHQWCSRPSARPGCPRRRGTCARFCLSNSRSIGASRESCVQRERRNARGYSSKRVWHMQCAEYSLPLRPIIDAAVRVVTVDR